MTKSSDADYFAHEHVTIIEPPRGWRMLDWRELLSVLTARDIEVRFRHTMLCYFRDHSACVLID